MTQNQILVQVVAVQALARDIVGVRMKALGAKGLPPYVAGSHIDLQLPNGMKRQYSLCGDVADTGIYQVAVGRSDTSRGGSQYIHERIRVGETLAISAPRNHFPCRALGGRPLFIAGGIGITPLLAMAREASVRDVPWEMDYFTRSPDRLAFSSELKNLGGDRVRFHAGHSRGDNQARLEERVRMAGENDIYCCGPSTLMDMVSKLCEASGRQPPLLERFGAHPAGPQPTFSPSAFTVTLNRSGVRIAVSESESILEALERCGVVAPFSCREGFCGACETRVISGDPLHFDRCLEPEHRRAGSMCLCVSRSAGGNLTLDL